MFILESEKRRAFEAEAGYCASNISTIRAVVYSFEKDANAREASLRKQSFKIPA